MRASRLLFPDLRHRPDSGFEHERERVRSALELGVGGFIVFGGTVETVGPLTRELRERSRHPILVGSDLERGAGQQVAGLTSLPPLGALGWLDELPALYGAGRLTAAEARSVGIDWIYAPVADLDVDPDNPIVATRSLGGDADRAARGVMAWIEGCAHGGGLACVKHFPGHGRTTTDSHVGLPVVDAGRREMGRDLVPFAAAVSAGVPSVMTAHVAYPALDPSGAPATLSRPIVTELLRETLEYGGVVVSDAFNMGAVTRREGGEAAAAVAAVAAGVDALLHPSDPRGAAEALDGAVARGDLDRDRLDEAVHRIEALARAAQGAEVPSPPPHPAHWAAAMARRTVHPIRGEAPRLAGSGVRVVVVDDDLGGPGPAVPRDVFPRVLEGGGARVLPWPTDGTPPDDGARTVVAVYAEPRGWKGRSTLSDGAVAAVRSTLADADDGVVVVLFSHPRNAAAVPPGVPVLCAWGGEPLMQEAAARVLLEGHEREAFSPVGAAS